MIVRVPASARNATSYKTLSFNLAPDESVVTGTDLRITVVDGGGASWTTLASAVNPLAVNRMPISGNPTLNKIVLQQVSIPVSSITGINLTNVREIRFAGAVGADGSTGATTAPGGAYLTDLAWSNPSIGTPVVAGSLPTIGVVPTTIEEGDNSDLPRTAAVVLSKPAATSVTGYFTMVGSASATTKVGPAMEAVTFAPGETCKTVAIPTLGDSVSGAAATSTYTMDVSNPQRVITGDTAFARVTVREDDGVAAPELEVPTVGVQGDACAEYEAQSKTFALASSGSGGHPGDDLVLTGTGYRPGETVTLSLDDAPVTTGLAAGDGSVSFATVVPAVGQHRFSATGAGSLRDSAWETVVRGATSTTLSISPVTPAAFQTVVLTATVTGTPTGVVEFFDGAKSLGTGPVTDGVSTLSVPVGFAAGAHSLTATLAQSAEADGSTSAPVAFTVARADSTASVKAGATVKKGHSLEVTVTITGVPGGVAPSGPVTVSFAGVSKRVTLVSGTAKVTFRASKLGARTVKAVYAGDANYLASSTTQVVTVTKARN
jgi:hypothetical protein